MKKRVPPPQPPPRRANETWHATFREKCFKALIILAVLAFSGCGTKEVQVTKLDMLKGGKTFAAATGTVVDQFILKKFPDAKIEYYNSVLDCAIAVKDGKVDATAYDLPIVKNIVAKNPGLIVLDELLIDDQYGFAVRMQDTALKGTMDRVLAELKADGTYEDMQKRWFPLKGSVAPMPDTKLSNENGVLKFGTSALSEPMSFLDGNQKVVGFDIEYASRIAKKLGKSLEIIDMEFGAMIPALVSEKVDMIGAGLSITEERAKKVLFSQCYYPSGIAAVVKDVSNGAAKKEEANSGNKLKSITDIKTKRIGVLLGSIHDSYATKTYPEASILQYQNLSDLLFGLNSEKVDVAFVDQTGVKDIFSKNPSLGMLAENVFYVDIAAGFNQENDALREKFNAFLKEIKANGTYKDMQVRWMEKENTDMPDIRSKKANGQLKAGIVSDLGMPTSFIKDGRLVGFDIEMGQRFAAYADLEYVTADLQFGAMLGAVSSKKIDLITSSLMITEERKKRIDFSDPYNNSGVSVIAKKDNIAGPNAQSATVETEQKSFLESISDSWYNNIRHEKRYLHIINGLTVTMIISILAALFGTIIGALVCYMRMSRNKLMSHSAKFYISLLRGTPVLVLLMMIYYVVFASVNINPVIVAVIAFGLNFGAYVSEMFRTSIEGIDKGQKEAAIAGGFARIPTFTNIILPQALRSILPVYKGEFISLIKMTSIVGYIAVQDLTKASDIIRSRTFDAFFPLIMVALIYLFLAWLLSWALGFVEVSVDPKRKRSKKLLEAKA